MVPLLEPTESEKETVSPESLVMFPAVSLACIEKEIALPAMTVAADEAMVDELAAKGPGVTVIVGWVDVTLSPLIVPEIVFADPETTPVNIAAYVPFPLSVTEERVPVEVPPVAAKATIGPPALIRLPAASFAVSVMVESVPEAIEAADTSMVD